MPGSMPNLSDDTSKSVSIWKLQGFTYKEGCSHRPGQDPDVRVVAVSLPAFVVAQGGLGNVDQVVHGQAPGQYA